MIAIAKTRFVRISPKKVRLVAQEIQGKRALEAMQILEFSPRRSSKFVQATLKQAIANAMSKESLSLDEEDLVISSVRVDDGPRLRRYRPGAHGRMNPYMHKLSHITIELNVSQVE